MTKSISEDAVRAIFKRSIEHGGKLIVSRSIKTAIASEAKRFVVWLPFPPATNNLFFNAAGRGRVTTDRYRAWQEEAAWRIHAQKPSRVMGPFSAEIVISRPDKRRRDLDGLAKPILDCLVKNSLVEDDSLCERLVMEWALEGEGVLVTVTKATK